MTEGKDDGRDGGGTDGWMGKGGMGEGWGSVGSSDAQTAAPLAAPAAQAEETNQPASRPQSIKSCGGRTSERAGADDRPLKIGFKEHRMAAESGQGERVSGEW